MASTVWVMPVVSCGSLSVYEDGAVSVQFTPPDTIPGPGGTSMAPDAGTIYSFVYRAQDPVVSGMGFAAVRNLVSFLRHASADEQGNPNPLSDLKDAPCASGTDCPSNPASNVDVAIGLGLSQSGRFLRDFLYQGFNKDAQGQKVFDTAPPRSPYPSVASGDLVPSDQFETGFPDLSDIIVPDGEDAKPINLNFTYGGLVNQLFVTDYSNAEPVVDLSRQYAVSCISTLIFGQAKIGHPGDA